MPHSAFSLCARSQETGNDLPSAATFGRLTWHDLSLGASTLFFAEGIQELLSSSSPFYHALETESFCETEKKGPFSVHHRSHRGITGHGVHPPALHHVDRTALQEPRMAGFQKVVVRIALSFAGREPTPLHRPRIRPPRPPSLGRQTA